MVGLGTVINTAAVIAGGIIGLYLKNGLKKNMQELLMKACGVAVIFIGSAGALSKMLVVNDGAFKTQGSMLLIFSLVIGSVIGEWVDIETKLDVVGERIKKAVKAKKEDNLFVEGFVNVSLIICVGAMAIVGAIQDGMSGDYSMLTAKAVLDMIIVMVFASMYGTGAVFSAIPIFVYQGAITLIAAFCGSFVNEVIVNDISFVGSVLIFCVGVNIAFGKKFRVGNMLPALIVPVVYEVVVALM